MKKGNEEEKTKQIMYMYWLEQYLLNNKKIVIKLFTQ